MDTAGLDRNEQEQQHMSVELRPRVKVVYKVDTGKCRRSERGQDLHV